MFNPDKPEVAAAQKVMLEILKEIHRICVENNITYWLTAGTLLGAVRHGGFIPWDDDCDIAMPREDYEKFLKIVPSCLPETMLLQTHESEPAYTLPFAKIRKKGTLLIETGETGEENYHHGIFVDIFPFDGYKYAWIAKVVKWSYVFRDKKKKYPKGTFKRFLVTFYTNVLMVIPVFLAVRFRDLLIAFPKLYRTNDDNSYMTYGFECVGALGTHRCDYLPTHLLVGGFEGEDFYVPSNVDAALVASFGKNYLILPPMNQRKSHSSFIEVLL